MKLLVMFMNDFNALPFLDDEVALAAPGVGEYEELRRRYGVAVPGVLRELLAVRNGGRVRRLWVTSRNAALRRGLHVSQFLFLKLDDFSPEGIVGCFRGWREAMGRQGLPFAMDEVGNVFFVDLSVEPGRVMFARQEGEIEVFAVSPDLETFFAELSEVDEPVGEAGLLLYDGPVKREVSPPSPVAAGKKWGCCSVRMLGVGLLLFLFFNWWGWRTVWEDGDFKVNSYGLDYILVYSYSSNYRRILDEQIVAMGRNDRYLVIQQWRDDANRFYLLEKRSFSLLEISAGDPYTREFYTRAEFERVKKDMDLPPFTWRNPWVFYPKDK